MEEDDFCMETKPSVFERVSYKSKQAWDKFCYKIGVKKEPDCNLVKHARTELAVIGMYEEDCNEMNAQMTKHILHMVREFSKEGHSGYSAAYTIDTLNKLLKFKPLAPLSGAESEWVEVSEDIWQNKRCSTVFKDESGVYNIDGKVFREPNGSCYTNRDSRVYITFPYTPVTEYVDVPAK